VENEVMMSEFNANNGFALQRLVKDHGVKVVEFNDRIYDAFGKASEEVFAETAASSPIAKRVTDSFLKARKELGAWNKLSDTAYVAKRNKVIGL
jgi:TRAP-type mannitol/chloroaromatic compound transport system substrate-binding protein